MPCVRRVRDVYQPTATRQPALSSAPFRVGRFQEELPANKPNVQGHPRWVSLSVLQTGTSKEGMAMFMFIFLSDASEREESESVV